MGSSDAGGCHLRREKESVVRAYRSHFLRSVSAMICEKIGHQLTESGAVEMERRKRVYAAIDLKSFYASVECVSRQLNPLSTHLVVADASRSKKTICLAVSPSLKAQGVPGRPDCLRSSRGSGNATQSVSITRFASTKRYGIPRGSGTLPPPASILTH